MIQAVLKWFVLGLIIVTGSVGLPLSFYHYIYSPNLLKTYYKPMIPILEVLQHELAREVQVMNSDTLSTDPLKHVKLDTTEIK